MKRIVLLCVLFGAGIFLMIGCGGVKPTLSESELQAGNELMFVENGTTLSMMNGRGGAVKEIIKFGRNIQSPVWSNGGQAVALFLMEEKGFDRFSSDNTKADLVVYKINGIEPRYLGKFEFEQSVDRHGWKYTTIPQPIWHPDDKKIFVVDKSGLHLVVLDGRVIPLIEKEKIAALDIGLSKAHVVYAIDKNVYIYNFKTQRTVNLNEMHPQLYTFLNKPVHALKLDPSEKSLAIGTGKDVLLLDLHSLNGRMIYRGNQPIRSILWHPTGAQLAVLEGSYASYSDMRIGSNPGGKIPGNFAIRCVYRDGKRQEKVFENNAFSDVRGTQISYSPDGKWLVFLSTTLYDHKKSIYIASTEGQGWCPLRQGNRHSFPVWRPQLKAPLELINQ